MTTTITVYPRTEPSRAWQYDNQPRSLWPKWVQDRCVLVDNNMLLERSSGRQLVNPSEWIVADLDGDIYSIPHDEFDQVFRRKGEE